MTDSPYTPPQATLYDERPGGQPAAPPAKAPSLMEQVTGVFSEPGALFDRLRRAPNWWPVLALFIGLTVAVCVAWVMHLDVDTFLANQIEHSGRPLPPGMDMDRFIEMQRPFVKVFSLVGPPVLVTMALFFVTLLVWGAARLMGEDREVSFSQGLNAVMTPSLVTLPKSLLLLVICLFRSGITEPPDQLVPTSLGFFLHPEGMRMRKLLDLVDPFVLAALALTYLACRRILRMGAGLAAAASFLAVLLLPLFGALMTH